MIVAFSFVYLFQVDFFVCFVLCCVVLFSFVCFVFVMPHLPHGDAMS